MADEDTGNGKKPAAGSVEELKAALGIMDITMSEDGKTATMALSPGSIFLVIFGRLGELDKVLNMRSGAAPRTEGGLVLLPGTKA
jgi:hypothetical protein